MIQSQSAAETLKPVAKFSQMIGRIKAEGRYRVFHPISRQAGRFPAAVRIADSSASPIKVWCSNDYLGMGEHPAVLAAMSSAIALNGAGSGGSRNISGSSPYHVQLEDALAELHNKEAALLFTSGYVANDESLAAIGKILPEIVFFSDEKNHRSLIEGIRHSGCEKAVFRHNDAADLEAKLAEYPPERPKMVVFESVYSMDGDVAPIPAIAAAARRFGAMTFLDESHAVGVYGDNGGGLARSMAAHDDITVIQGGFGKGFGSTGGYIAGDRDLIDAVRSIAPGFIFTTSLPPSVAAASLASVQHLMTSQAERKKLFRNVRALNRELAAQGLPLLPSQSHIVPVLVGDSVACKFISDELISRFGLYLQPINFPSVPRGQERLRITISASHSEADIVELCSALKDCFAEARTQGLLN